ncbi:MAG: sigma-70 family RNA polymerase sigma factor [Alphaproteobacteria bacterium]|nr:sigma-70 family RNA polymerase sigma factor [Alphaproteobacteria bacterium]
MNDLQDEEPPRDPDQSPDWNSLLCSVATQDRAAFASLFTHFAPRVKSYMLRLGSDAAQAEELAQEAMAAVWRKADRYDPERAAASTWIFTVARNLRIDAFRRQNHPELDPNDPALVPELPVSADLIVARKQDASLIHKALAELSQEQREVLRLSFFDDQTHMQISETLDIPLGTVKSRIRLAFGRIRTMLEDKE